MDQAIAAYRRLSVQARLPRAQRIRRRPAPPGRRGRRSPRAAGRSRCWGAMTPCLQQPGHGLARNGPAPTRRSPLCSAPSPLDPELCRVLQQPGQRPPLTEGRLDEAIAAYRQPSRSCPTMPSLQQPGGVYKEQGRLDPGLASFRTAVALKPGLRRGREQPPLRPSFSSRPRCPGDPGRASRVGRGIAAPLAAQIRPHPNDRAPDRRLRVGFVSPDFHGHPVGQLLLPLFTHHDRGHTEFFAYSDVREPDALTEQAQGPGRPLARHHRPERPGLAERIRADRIDILVDLASIPPTIACSSSPASQRRCR